MKKLVLLLTLVSVSVSFARPNSHTNLVFGGGFGGAAFNDYEYSVPVGSESWAGFSVSDTSIYPIVMASGAQVTFQARSTSGNPANMRLRFEYNPYPDVDPSYDTASVTISNDVLTEYTIDIPSQGANTFSSFLFYNETFGETIYMTNFIISGLDDGDTTIPTPNPASFAVAPATVSDDSITMTATAATDTSGVEYYFACTTDSNFDSGWQSDAEYTVTGLTASTTYSFTVQVRDTSYAENTTTASAAASATTSGADNTPPSPNPTSATADATAATIQITASPSTDASGVEYKFTNTAGSGPSSDWQSSNVYTASGLEPGTAYTYSVQARDLSAAQNATTAGSVSATTLSISETSLTSALTNLSGTSDDGVTIHDLADEGFEVASTTSAKAITFNNSGVIFDIAGSGDSGRNHLVSIADNFDAVDFTFEVTVTRSANSQQAFFGVGTGADGTWGLPDFEQAGGAYMLQMQEADNSTYRVTNLGASTWNPEDDAANAASPLGTHRLQLAGDVSAGTFTISVDENYAGGDFAADSIQGSVFFDEIWDTSAQPTQNPNYDEDEEVYVPGGQTPSGQSNDGAWEEAAGGGAGAVYTYPETGGADDDGGYLQIDSSSGAWAVAVVSTDRNDPDGKLLPIANYGIAGDELITFEMDMKEFDNPSGTATAGIKIEWYDENGSQISNTGDMKKSLTTEWATYRWNAGVPTDAVYIVLVPVQHDDLTAGYDNLAIVPNPAVSGAIPTVAKLIFGGDEGVTFKDVSITVDGGAVVVDPFSISSISSITGGSVITWTAQSGVTYEVQYKTSLVGGTWQTTGSSVTGDGSVSATSDVDAASAFFRVIGQ